MAVQAELVCLDPFPAQFSPLNVLVPEVHFRDVLRIQARTAALLFTPESTSYTRKEVVLLCALPWPVEFPAADGEALDNIVRLWSSSLFLRLHRLPPHAAGTAQVLTPPTLTKVVVAARTPRSFRWGSSDLFTSALQAAVSRPEGVLVRSGDPLLLMPPCPAREEHELEVLSCSPAEQGRISADTAVVVTRWTPPSGRSPASDPLTSLIASDFAHFTDSLAGSSLLCNRKLLGSGFTGFLEALECLVDVCVVPTEELVGAVVDRDVDSCVCVSWAGLLRLGLFSREWVMLSGSSPAHSRPALVLPLDAPPRPHMEICVSTSLWFNLTGAEPIPVDSAPLRIKRWPLSDFGLSVSSCRFSSPKFACELHLQPVITQFSQQGADQLLSNHFTVPRLVCEGDILSVPAYNSEDEATLRGLVLHFRVQKVCVAMETGGVASTACLADKTHTSLYLGGSTNSMVPFYGEEVGALWSSLAPPGLSGAVEQITQIFQPHLGPSGAVLGGCSLLLQGPAGSGKVTAVRAACRRLHLHLVQVECVSLCADTPAVCEQKLRAAFQRAELTSPALLLLRSLQLIGQGDADDHSRVHATLQQLVGGAPCSVVVVATVTRRQALSVDVMSAFIHQVELQPPGEQQRRDILSSLAGHAPLGPGLDLEGLARTTAGLVLGDLKVLLTEAGRVAHSRLVQTCTSAALQGAVSIQQQDVCSAQQRLQDASSNNPKIPCVRWEDVGGLQEVKQEVLDTIQLPLQRPDLLALGLHRTGLLLHGPPGTGKTLLAKAIATETSMAFLSVKGPELINMYVGQSEENVREVFSRAKAAAPCVVFFDELDSLAPSRGRSGDSGGVMDRVVSQLVAELDGLQASRGVFVIGATNRADLLDQALLRPGRFDKQVHVGVNKDRSSQLQVMSTIVRKFHLAPDVSLEEVLSRCPTHMSGADLYAVCSDAMMASVKRKTCLVAHGLDSETSPILVSAEDFSRAVDHCSLSDCLSV